MGEGRVEVEALAEVVQAVLLAAGEQAGLDQEEDHLAPVEAVVDPPPAPDLGAEGAEELLQGDGLKRGRYLELAPDDDIPVDPIGILLSQAIALFA